MPAPAAPPSPARTLAPGWWAGPAAAFVLLAAINLVNFFDRYLPAAFAPQWESEFAAGSVNPKAAIATLFTAFLVAYTFTAPVFGWLAGRVPNRWWVVGVAVVLWSLASGASGLAVTYFGLLATRALIGIGEAAYTPVGLALISESYPPERRARMISLFYTAVPVGSALGFTFGGWMADSPLGWRWAFYLVVLPGLLLGLLCFLRPDPRRATVAAGDAPPAIPTLSAYLTCFRTPSWALNLAGYTAITFVLGAIVVFVPQYVYERQGRYVVTPGIRERLGESPLPAEVRDGLRALLGHSPLDADAFAVLAAKQVPADLWPAVEAVWPRVEAAARMPTRDGAAPRYQLTTASWLQLGTDPLPADARDGLAALEGQTFEGADAFKAAVRRHVPEKLLRPRWTWLREASRTADSPGQKEAGSVFGGIIVVTGLAGTMLGAWFSELLRRFLGGSELAVAGTGALLGVPFYLLFLWLPFPWAWPSLGVGVLLLFLHTGLVNAVFANVTTPAVRAHGFALALLVMHALGDVISPPIVGYLVDAWDWQTGFVSLSAVLVLAGGLWLTARPFVAGDTAKVA